jgi:hypothetical protein
MSKRQMTRQELYNLIWEQSATKAAKELTVNFAALRRICSEYDIPRPGSDYWTAVRLGRRVTKAPLPPTPSGLTDTILIDPLQKRPAKSAPKAADATEATAEQVVLANFKHCHPLVRSTWEFFKTTIYTDPQGRIQPSARQKCLDLSVTKALARRGLSIFQKIIEACEQEGWTVYKPETNYYRKYSETLVVIDGIEVDVAINERAVKRPATEKEKQAAAESWLAPRTFFDSTGLLRVGIGSMRFEGRHAIEETKDSPLEKRIPEIVEALKKEVDDCRKHRAYHEEQARIQAETEQARLAEQRKREEEVQRQRELERMAGRWQTSEQVRNLALVFEKQMGSLAQQNPAAMRWLTWARSYADKIDPVLSGAVEKAVYDLPL